MHSRPVHVAVTALFAVTLAAGVTNGCAAGTRSRDAATSGTGGAGIVASTASGTGGMGSAWSASTSSQSGSTGSIRFPEGGSDEPPPPNPCGTQCGPTELCDPAHLGLDDNCNGEVDEGCTCNPGQAHWCFKGDPSYHGHPGCYDGSET
jgi:hypothetical protein